MNKPLVSIAMPVRNCEKTIAAAVRSILLQTFTDWELLIFDDGSTDNTFGELKSFNDRRIHMHRDEQCKGLPARLNQSIAMAAGEYFARMDGDDISYPRRLDMQLNFLRSNREIDLVGGGVIVFEEGGHVIGKRIPSASHMEICCRPEAGFPIAHPTYCGKRSWFEHYGYSARMIRGQDQDLLLRAYRDSHFSNLSRVVLGYREQLNTRKILQGRSQFARNIFSEFRQRKQTLRGLAGFAEQSLKGVVDIAALLTGLRPLILGFRCSDADESDIMEWKSVWESVQLRCYKND
jgi:glycosyltransferase involved in cell wall biosynthesis